MRSVIDVPPCAAAFDSGGSVGVVDVDAFHAREVDHHTTIAGPQSGAAVPAPAHGQGELMLTSEIDGADDIGDIYASGDESRPLIDHAIVDLPRLFVLGIARLDQVAS